MKNIKTKNQTFSLTIIFITKIIVVCFRHTAAIKIKVSTPIPAFGYPVAHIYSHKHKGVRFTFLNTLKT